MKYEQGGPARKGARRGRSRAPGSARPQAIAARTSQRRPEPSVRVAELDNVVIASGRLGGGRKAPTAQSATA